MKTASNEPELLTVEKLFKDGKYIIPLYQRNYAWGESEIDQLIQDIWDSCPKEEKTDEQSSNPYYIGSLVVSNRGEFYEVIDGQQRHTTLSILLAVLRSEQKSDVQLHEITETNLSFESREKSSNTLRQIFKQKPCDGEEGMITAYKVCQKKLKVENIDIQKFTSYLMNQVKILRTEVPDGTDLNHYFEIMNNRGEQLEKHEVLKARFMSAFKENEKRAVFAQVWDACADMNRYVVMGFGAEQRKSLFGDDLKGTPSSFDEIVKCIGSVTSEGTAPCKIEDLLQGDGQVSSDKKEDPNAEGIEKFSSIITFSNFLLHVLRLQNEKDTVVLDDKKLLDQFPKEPNREYGEEFITSLLQYRFLLDNFVIKREHEEGKDGKWCLKRRKTYQSATSDNYVNTFEEDGGLNNKLVMVQSMFHVSYPTQNYKYWLTGVLKYLFEIKEKNFNGGQGLLDFLERLSDRFFFGRFAKEEVSYDEILKSEGSLAEPIDEEKLHQGTGVHNFVFNRLDYLLWSQRDSYFPNDKDTKAKNFTFTFKSSVEHVCPQTHDESNTKDNTISNEKLHSFGNLALVSSSFNSSASNKSYKEKREAFNAKKNYESLKLALIYQREGWDDTLCVEHEKKMLEVLDGLKKSII